MPAIDTAETIQNVLPLGTPSPLPRYPLAFLGRTLQQDNLCCFASCKLCVGLHWLGRVCFLLQNSGTGLLLLLSLVNRILLPQVMIWFSCGLLKVNLQWTYFHIAHYAASLYKHIFSLLRLLMLGEACGVTAFLKNKAIPCNFEYIRY